MPDDRSQEKIISEIMGVKAEVTLESGLYKGAYSSSLEDIGQPETVDAGLYGLLHPMLKGNLLPLYRGVEVVLRFETSACIYQGRAEVVRSAGNMAIPLLWVRLLGPLQRVQRRRFVRVPCKIKARAFLLELNVLNVDGRQGGLPNAGASDGAAGDTVSEETLLSLPKVWFPVQLKDISLGGVGGTVTRKEAAMCYFGARYLLQMSIADNTFLLATDMVKLISKPGESAPSIGLSYEGLPVCVEKIMGSFIRQQELTQKKKN